ncbi:MAG: PAS domain-containing protein [Deltaproteobacteria bacterium]|nr:PAS domain-containing protein [Deltaproteobacteria bacterium]
MIDFPEALRPLVDRMEAIVYLATREEPRRALLVSGSANISLGFSPEQLASEPEFMLAHVHPDDVERLRAELRQPGDSMGRRHFKYRFVTGDGRVISLRETMIVNPEDDGPATGVMLDATELILPQRAQDAVLKANDGHAARVALCDALAEAFGLQHTAFIDARAKQVVLGSHAALGERMSTLWLDNATVPDLAAEAMVSRKPILSTDAVTGRVGPGLEEAARGSMFALAVPLMGEGLGAPWAAIIGLSNRVPLIQAQYPRALETMARQVALGLQRADLVERLRHTITERQRLADALVRGHEEERARLARELHDGAGQALTAVAIQLDLAERASSGAAKGSIAQARSQIEHTLEDLRRLAHALRPAALDGIGLSEALAELVRAMSSRKLEVTLQAPAELPFIAPETALATFRIAQGALTNVVRHSQARTARLALAVQGDVLHFEVADDGRGFDPESRQGGMGLLAMRERVLALNGQFDIVSQPGSGTRVRIQLPR